MNDKNDYLKKLAAFEQAAAELRPIAGVLSSYFNALVESGFARSEALNLTSALQSKIFDAGLNNLGQNTEEDDGV